MNYTYDQRANGKGHLTTVVDPSGTGTMIPKRVSTVEFEVALDELGMS